MVVVLEVFALPGCTFTITGGCALYRAEDNFPGTKQLLMQYFVIEYAIFKDSIMLLVVFWN